MNRPMNGIRFIRYVICTLLWVAAFCMADTALCAHAKSVDPRAPRNSDGKVFVHPGISYTQGDLDRMKAMVDAGVQPWKRCFDALAGSRWTGHGVKTPWRGEEDWGFDELLKYYIYKNGQCEETCRDMAHTNYGLFNYVGIAEMFWNQGDDLYGALDNRILLGLEWNLRYNLSDWMPTGYTDKEDEATFENGLFYKAYTRSARWTALKPSPHGRGAQGGPGAPRTAALMHYSVVKGVPDEKCKWLRKSVEDTLANNGCETWGFGPNWYYEYCGWGTLTKTRTKWMRGDPVTWVKGRRVSGAHKLPGVIRISDWDYYPLEDRPRTHRKKRKDGWSDGDWALYTVTSPEAKAMKVSLVYTSHGRAEVVIASDGGKPRACELIQAQEKRVVTIGRVSVPAGASVIRFAVKKSAPGFRPLGLKFE